MKLKTDKDYIDYFVGYITLEKHYSPYTRENYQRSLEQFSEYLQDTGHGITGLPSVTQAEVKGFLAYLQSVRTLKRISQLNRLAALKSFYRFLRRRGLIDHYPCDGLGRLKAEKKLPTFLSLQEIVVFLETLRKQQEEKRDRLSARNHALFELLYASGIRVGEAANLRRKDIDFKRQTLRVNGKGGKERIVPLNGHAAAALQEYWHKTPDPEPEEAAFLNRFGKPLTPRGIRKVLNKCCLEQGLEKPVSPHTFRHTFATHFLSGGAELRLVQEALGHASLSTTQIYTHINWEKMKSVYNDTHPHSGKKVDLWSRRDRQRS
ncbi:MAG TPA: tyrosine-type recombinase/integrase [Atribacteraceae bacterium]|nr:tyrosine-type recombinase/integrase [Atribacteraceae bacterium]